MFCLPSLQHSLVQLVQLYIGHRHHPVVEDNLILDMVVCIEDLFPPGEALPVGGLAWRRKLLFQLSDDGLYQGTVFHRR